MFICSIQLISKTLFIDGDPVVYNVSFPGPCKHMNSVTFSNTDTNTKQQRFIGQIQAYTTYVTLMYNTYTNMYIHHTVIINDIQGTIH